MDVKNSHTRSATGRWEPALPDLMKDFMGKRNRYQDHVDPEYRRWGSTFGNFPGIDECEKLILDGKATGASADIITNELAEHANEHLNEVIEMLHKHPSNDVSIYMLMAVELAALPASVEFLSDVLRDGDTRFTSYAKRALIAIDTRESRTVFFNAKK